MYKDRSETISVGNRQLKTRIVMPPVATYQCSEDGKVTDAMLEYYGARAANPNVSMIITEHSYINLQGKAKAKQMSISSDSDIDGLTHLVESIHEHDTLVLAQLNHAGSAAASEVSGMEPVSSSPVVLPVAPMMGSGTIPRQLTKDEIKKVAEDFALAAGRAKKAGYDGVEIHSAHAYLLNQFYSPLTNKREDEYGGSLENRLRIHREVIKAVREEIGDDLIIAVRLGGSDYTEGGSTINDAVYAAKMIEQAGADMLDISGGMCRYTRPGHTEPGYFKDLSLAIKKAVNIPVMLTGGVKTISDAEELLNEGAADLIGVGRELLKSASWSLPD